jgi:hypothetical protein
MKRRLLLAGLGFGALLAWYLLGSNRPGPVASTEAKKVPDRATADASVPSPPGGAQVGTAPIPRVESITRLPERTEAVIRQVRDAPESSGPVPAKESKSEPRNESAGLPPGTRDVAGQTHDAEGDPIPVPPGEFRGTALMWRLRFPMAAEDFDAVIKTLGYWTVNERTSILHAVVRAKDPNLGKLLMTELPNVPVEPVTLHDYAYALIEVAAVTPGGAGSGPDGVSASSRTSASVEGLRLLASVAKGFHAVMSESGWGGIQSKIERIREVEPAALETDAGRQALQEIRRALDIELDKATQADRRFGCGVDGFRLAHCIADEGTHETLLKLLERWDVVRKRFPMVPGRPDISALYHASMTLLDPPCSVHGAGAARSLAVCAGVETEEEGCRRIDSLLLEFSLDRAMPKGMRDIFTAARKPGRK